jgi:hypothetical protein
VGLVHKPRLCNRHPAKSLRLWFHHHNLVMNEPRFYAVNAVGPCDVVNYVFPLPRNTPWCLLALQVSKVCAAPSVTREAGHRPRAAQPV